MKVPLNLEVENKGSRVASRRIISNTNQSNYDIEGGDSNEELLLHKSSTNKDLAGEYLSPEQDYEYTCDNYYCLPVEERNLLWNAAREHKLETIRRLTNNSGMEE